MRGPIFELLLRNQLLETVPRESVDDIEMLYSIILSQRHRQNELKVSEADEVITLTSLCFFNYPGKTLRYRHEVWGMRFAFQRIASIERLQTQFRRLVSPNLISAKSLTDLKFNTISDVFRYTGEDRDTTRSR